MAIRVQCPIMISERTLNHLEPGMEGTKGLLGLFSRWSLEVVSDHELDGVTQWPSLRE